MSKYGSMTCWVSQRANRFHVFTFIRIQSIHFRSKSKNLMAQKDHCIRICLNSFTFRWTLAVIKVLFFLFCQYRMWNVFRRDGFASNRLSCRIVCLFFFSPKTWRKLMVLCNISLTCWIIYSPRSMHTRSRTYKHTHEWWDEKRAKWMFAPHITTDHTIEHQIICDGFLFSAIKVWVCVANSFSFFLFTANK